MFACHTSFFVFLIISVFFEKWNTTCTCAKLRGSDGITDRIRSCRGCVSDCARIVEDYLFPREFEPYEPRQDNEE